MGAHNRFKHTTCPSYLTEPMWYYDPSLYLLSSAWAGYFTFATPDIFYVSQNLGAHDSYKNCVNPNDKTYIWIYPGPWRRGHLEHYFICSSKEHVSPILELILDLSIVVALGYHI